MRKFDIRNGEVELNHYELFRDVLDKVWGKCVEEESEDGEVDLFLKLGHKVARWVDGAAVGWVEMPSFVANDEYVEL